MWSLFYGSQRNRGVEVWTQEELFWEDKKERRRTAYNMPNLADISGW
jgi:hypothetical protein